VPKDAQLSIQTTNGSASRAVHVVAAVQIPEGHPAINNVTGAIGTINAGGTYTFTFQVDASAVSIQETYNIQVSYANATPAAVPASAWQAATTLIGVSNGQVTVTPGTPVSVGVQVVVPTGATSVNLGIRAVSVHNDPASSVSATPVAIQVGQAPPPSDPRIHLAIGQIGLAAPFKQVQIDGLAGIEVQYQAAGVAGGRTVQIPIDVSYDVASTVHYDVSLDAPDATLWTLGAVTPNDTAYTAGSPQQVHVALTLLASGPSNETKFLTFVATRRDSDPIGPISNYLRFPITGYTP
jgi:hypothetical protein